MYDRGHRAAVAIACAGAFLAFLDTTIVNIAFPDISASFAGSGRDALSWVLDGYFVVIAALLVPAGGPRRPLRPQAHLPARRRRLHRREPALRVAPSLELLIAFRVLQGIGAAMIAPTSLAIVLDSFPPERRAAGVGLWGAAAAARRGDRPDPRRRAGRALRLAPRLPRQPAARRRDPARRRAGRWPSARSRDSRLPDLPGAAMLALGLALITLAIVEGNDWGWTAPPRSAAFAAGAAAARRRRRPQPQPPAPDRRARRSSPTAPSASATSAPCSSPPPSSR